jgi:hypothetical protein
VLGQGVVHLLVDLEKRIAERFPYSRVVARMDAVVNVPELVTDAVRLPEHAEEEIPGFVPQYLER